MHILPSFHRSHIQTHASGLLLNYCFNDLPAPASADPPGLALRRVYWCLNHLNTPSRAAAQRLGFTYEGVLRWDRVLSEGKPGVALPTWAVERETALGRGLVGRHSVGLGMGWDDWFEMGGQERIDLLMSRKVERKMWAASV